MRRGVEIDESGVRELLQSNDIADMLKEVGEKIMKKDNLISPLYTLEDSGVVGVRRTYKIERTDERSYIKELKDGKLKKAARSRLGDLK